MLRSYTIIFIFFFVHCTLVYATKYYVSSSSGDDAVGRDGKSEATAWKTISKVNGQTYLPGDSILFKKGDVWRETLEVPSSGTSGKYIIFANYGVGANPNPKILGSNVSTSWTDQGGNIWKSNTTFTNPRSVYNYCDLTFEMSDGSKLFGTNKANTGLLVAEYNWTWSANYIYVYATSNPTTKYNSVEIPQRLFGFSTMNKEFLHVDGIDVLYAAWIGYDVNSAHTDHINIKGFIIENCEVGFIGGKNNVVPNGQVGFGIATVYSDLIIRHCTIHDCGRRGISLDNYGYGFTAENALIENNIIYNGYHTTALDCNTGSGNYTGSWNNITFRYNLVYENETESNVSGSNQIFLQRYGSTTLSNIYIYSNIFKFSRGNSISIERADGVYIYNNTFYGTNTSGSPYYHIYAETSPTNVEVKNNIFYTLLSNDTGGNGAGVVIYGISSSVLDANYNLYYRINNNLRIQYINGKSYYMNDKAAINSALGWEINSVFSDPLFYSASDYHLKDSSPAIGKGIKVTFIEKDYSGENFNNPPSIGAYEGKKGYIPPPVIPPDTTTTGKQQILILYPNPSHGDLTILREGSVLALQSFRIIDMSGKIIFKDFLEEGVKSKQFPLNLDSGIYLIQVLSGSLTTAAHKLIVVSF